MNITVLIPTYRRPQDLKRCLIALGLQLQPAEEILVVVRNGDDETQTFLQEPWDRFPGLRVISVCEPGVLAAMTAGLAQASGDIIALTDDDAAPHPDWLSRIATHFDADEKLGGVGGRDWVYFDGQLEDGVRLVVGKVQWFGRIAGFHHIGIGTARSVDFLKGVNSAYRTQVLHEIGFDQRMKGTGAQVHWELALGLAIRSKNWKLLYDPTIGVDHFPATRFDADQRNNMEREVLRDAVHNETLALWTSLPIFQKMTFLAWWILVGSRLAPGFLFAVYSMLSRHPQTVQRWLDTMRGRLQGLKTCYQKLGNC